jgi:hypothetical protein
MHPHTRNGLPTALLGLAGLLLPATLTLHSVKDPGRLVVASADPSPFGYTISLLLFLVPDLALLVWLARQPLARVERQALFATISGIFLVGCFLDFLFAHSFFVYPNTGATLRLRLPGWSFAEMRWIPDLLPVEEFAFYAAGGIFMAAVYVWADLTWMPRRGPTAREHAREYLQRRLRQVHWKSLAAGLLLVAAAVAYRKLRVPEPGFPGYFVFLVCVAVIPVATLYLAAAPLVNWGAFTVMFVALQALSILWEATLAVPYGWWNYRRDQMLGIFIGPWSDLPVEGVVMWIMAGGAAVVLYEVFRVHFHRRDHRREAARLATAVADGAPAAGG